MKHLS